MKFTILGFSQRKAVEMGLDINHLLVLRWFVDFKDSGCMATKIIKDDKFYWVKYEGVLEALPILKTTSKDTVYRYFKKLAKANVLKHETVKQGGVWSFYALGDKYAEFIDDEYEVGNKSEGVGNKSEGVGNKSECVGNKSGTNNSSINNSSINNYIYTDVFSYLNEKTGKRFNPKTKSNQKLVSARVNEGFTLEDFKTVIDNKVESWKGTDMEQYLRPNTLFGNKFESYLNEKPIKPSKKVGPAKTDFTRNDSPENWDYY